MARVTDAFRLAKAHTPLGPELVFREMQGREELSRMFDYRLELVADENSGIDPKALLGRGITVEIETKGGGRRFIDAQCARFGYIGHEKVRHRNTRLFRYEARLRPWTWYMSLESHCRVFQNQTVPSILRTVLSQYSAFPVDWKITRSYRSWEYCVQYQETDFNFMSRLLEHEGIYYYFRHAMGSHTLVLCDDIGAHDPLPGYARIPHVFTDQMVAPGEEWIDHLQMWQEVASGMFETDDFDFKLPQPHLRLFEMNERPHPHGDYNVYDWPGGYWHPDHGSQYARIRLQELQQAQEMVSAQSNVRGLTPGYLFTLERCPRRDQNREYLIVAANMSVRNNPYVSGIEDTAHAQFTLIAQPSGVPYRPARLTPKPRTMGPQTAVVVGEEGKDEEIVCDEHGRVRVQFHWDHDHTYNEQSSCWIRVSSGWAGSNWGQITIPRVNQEVIVDFLNGDPDYPIIVGRVYNGEHMPPYKLPRWKEYSTWKSRSTKNGGNNDYNEIRFYDYKSKEQIYIQAQWRMDMRVKGSKYECVRGSTNYSIGGGYYLTVGRNVDLHVNGDLYATVDGKINASSGKEVVLDLQSSCQQLVKTLMEANAKNMTLEGKFGIVLKSGASFVKISPLGVTIQGPMVYINPGGSEQGTGDPDFDDALDAAGCDTGEPGYLDRPPRGGPWQRRRRRLQSQHGPTISSQASRLTRTGGRGTEEDQILVAEQVSRIPPHVLDRLERNGTRIVACRDSVTDYRSDLRGVQPRGWPAGSTWDTVPGANMRGQNEVVIATRGHGTEEGAHVPRAGEGHGSSNLAIHETMHGVDDTGSGGSLSNSPNFQAARTADSATLDDYESQPGEAGPRETWAESAARYYGGDPNDAANHPNLNQYWAGDPLNPANPRP